MKKFVCDTKSKFVWPQLLLDWLISKSDEFVEFWKRNIVVKLNPVNKRSLFRSFPSSVLISSFYAQAHSSSYVIILSPLNCFSSLHGSVGGYTKEVQWHMLIAISYERDKEVTCILNYSIKRKASKCAHPKSHFK